MQVCRSCKLPKSNSGERCRACGSDSFIEELPALEEIVRLKRQEASLGGRAATVTGEKVDEQKPPGPDKDSPSGETAPQPAPGVASSPAQDAELTRVERLEHLLKQAWKHKVATLFTLISILAIPTVYYVRKWTTDLPRVLDIKSYPPEIPLKGKVQLTPFCRNPDGSTLKLRCYSTVGDIKCENSEMSASLDVTGFEPSELPFRVYVTIFPEDSYQRLGTEKTQEFWIVRPPNSPPRLKKIETKPDPAVINVGDSVALEAEIEDPDKDEELHYQWWEEKGRVVNDDSPITTLITSRIDTSANTDIVVTLTVKDKQGAVAVGKRTIKVTQGSASGQKPGTLVVRSGTSNVAPIMDSFQPSRSVVNAGESVNLLAVMAKPNETLSYTWSTTGGRLKYDGAKAILDTSGVEPSTIRVSLTVKDEKKGGSVSGNVLITVLPPKGQQGVVPAAAPAQSLPSPTPEAIPPDKKNVSNAPPASSNTSPASPR